MEQLVPPSLLVQHAITTRTPLPKAGSARPVKHAEVWEVEDNDKVIQQILRNHSIQPSGIEKRNRRMVKQLAEDQGRNLVYV